jgi:hypothetical protein
LSRIGFGFRLVVCFALCSPLTGLAQQPATTPQGPVPPAILAAKKIFLSNSGASSSFYSGDQNRAYNQLYAGLQGSGFFQMVGDPSDADLVLELQFSEPVPGSTTFRLLIYHDLRPAIDLRQQLRRSSLRSAAELRKTRRQIPRRSQLIPAQPPL